MPDAPTREDGLAALARKRTHAAGAALFSILPHRRNPRLLRLLVSYEIALDFLDNVHERSATAANGSQLHLALIEAVNADGPVSDYYSRHAWRDDGGYLGGLVESSREGCLSLPCYARVRARLIREACRAQVLGINHDPRPERRDARLKRWAQREYGEEQEASWFELTSAVSASLTIHALLALAAQARCQEGDIAAVYETYFPWVSAVSTMLDSFVDRGEDILAGNHIYVDHYPGAVAGCRRIMELIARSMHRARRLPGGHRHTVIVACMVAMYLSRDSARAPHMRARTAGLVRAGGPLARVLVPVLRLWRVVYGQQTA